MADDDARLVYGEAEGAMEKALRSLRAELQKVRTGRASTALLDGIQVNYYDTPTPLNQLASLSTPDPRLIVIAPFDKSIMSDVEKAVLASDLGLTPSNDGKVVRIPIPPLTEERRKELVKHIHRVAEERKVGVREARRDAISMLKDLESEGAVPADDKRREEKRIQSLTDGFVQKIDQFTEQKEEEIMTV